MQLIPLGKLDYLLRVILLFSVSLCGREGHHLSWSGIYGLLFLAAWAVGVLLLLCHQELLCVQLCNTLIFFL